jgi:uncharacterized protein (TIGR02444 family)
MPADNEFWRFSLRVYAAPGVAEECLALQERAGIDVNVLLFCAWLGAERGVALDASNLHDCERAVSEWHDRVVRHLREARCAMNGLAGGDDIRAQVKKLELEAERLEQESLYAFAAQRWPARGGAEPRQASRDNLDLFLRAHGAIGTGGAAALLAAALR